MQIILTGANGQIGKEIQRKFAQDTSSELHLMPFDRASLDITNEQSIQSCFEKFRPNLIINAAAYTAVDRAEQEKELCYAVNFEGCKNLANICDKFDIPLIHLSTDYIFNSEKQSPYTETDLAAPLNIYGQSKWQAEETIRQHVSQHIILRTSWVFSSFGQNFVKTVLRLAKEQSIFRIVDDQIGCPTSASDIADVIYQIISHIKNSSAKNVPWGTYHYSNSPAVSWYEFAHAILNCFHLKKEELVPISTAEYQTLAQRPLYSVLDCQKIGNVFGIEQNSWYDALKILYQENVLYKASQ